MENIRQLSVMNETRPNYGYNPGREVELPTVRGRLRIRVEERQDHSKYCFVLEKISIINFNY